MSFHWSIAGLLDCQLLSVLYLGKSSFFKNCAFENQVPRSYCSDTVTIRKVALFISAWVSVIQWDSSCRRLSHPPHVLPTCCGTNYKISTKKKKDYMKKHFGRSGQIFCLIQSSLSGWCFILLLLVYVLNGLRYICVFRFQIFGVSVYWGDKQRTGRRISLVHVSEGFSGQKWLLLTSSYLLDSHRVLL